jgi:hypothetical protein
MEIFDNTMEKNNNTMEKNNNTMEIFDENKFNKLYNKLKEYNNKLSLSDKDKLNSILISFKDFLFDFYTNYELLYDEEYMIAIGNNILDKFDILEFNDYEKFLTFNYIHFDSISAECLYFSSKNNNYKLF